MIDSHAHVNFFKDIGIIEQVITNFKGHGGENIIDISTEYSDLELAIKIKEKFPELITIAFAVHPETVHKNREIQSLKSELARMEKLLRDSSVTFSAIGETGFDIFRVEEEKGEIIAVQEELFSAHISLAQKNSKPVIIHARGENNNDYTMHRHTLTQIQKHASQGKFCFHSFAGDKTLLKEILDIDGYIGINGVLTYSGVDHLREALQFIPKERLLIETDTPFLVPSNMDRNMLQDKKYNEPLGILYVAKLIAKILGASSEAILDQTSQNAKEFFNL